jgi:hypothetical protein
MPALGEHQTSIAVRLSAHDAALLRRIARKSRLTLSAAIRGLIRARIASDFLARPAGKSS